MAQDSIPPETPDTPGAQTAGREAGRPRPGDAPAKGNRGMLLFAGLALAAIVSYVILTGESGKRTGDDLDTAQQARGFQPTPRPAPPSAPASAPAYQPLPAASQPAPSISFAATPTAAVASAPVGDAETREAEVRQRWHAPLMIGGAAEAATPPAAVADKREVAVGGTQAAAAAASAPPPSFLDRVGGRPTGRGAVVFPDPMSDYKIFEGKFISAVLETAIDTDMPGHIRAMVDEDVYGEAQRVVLLPRMTRLIGEYDTRIRAGQARVLVAWRRAIRPDGATITLGSYGADSLGRAGMPGLVDPHFMRRFGTAFLMSMVMASQRSKQQTIVMMPGIFGVPAPSLYRDEATQALRDIVKEVLAEGRDVLPTVRVPQGSRIRVFVARDLDFSGLAPPEHAASQPPGLLVR